MITLAYADGLYFGVDFARQGRFLAWRKECPASKIIGYLRRSYPIGCERPSDAAQQYKEC